MLLGLALPWVAALTAAAAPPPLETRTASTVTVDVPVEWKLLADVEKHNVTMSKDLATTLTLYWLPYRWVPPDAVLAVLVDTVNKQLPVGELKEIDRAPMPGFEERFALQRGRVMRAEVSAMGYTMNVALAALVDEAHQRVLAGFLLAPPETFVELSAPDTLVDVVRSFHLEGDPPLPVPGWWWGREVPEALRAAPAPTP